MRLIRLLTLAIFLLALPCLALAQDAAPADGGGLPLAAIVAALGALASVIGAVLKWIPDGYKTYANLAVAGIAAVLPALTELSTSGQAVTLGATIAALIGAAIGRAQAKPV